MNIRGTTIMIVLSIPLFVQAQQDEPIAGQEPRAQPIEEVLVTGERFMYQLRTQMMEAEQKAYEIFNQFNDEKRFNISCSTHQPTGSRIQRQVCQPGFQLDASRLHASQYVESTREALGQGGSSFTVQQQPQEAIVASQMEDYRRKLREVAQENPEFLDAIIRYSELRERYEEATRTSPE
jgi:hypothetical protein